MSGIQERDHKGTKPRRKRFDFFEFLWCFASSAPEAHEPLAQCLACPEVSFSGVAGLVGRVSRSQETLNAT